jgi:hypothetical protein
MHFFLVIVEFNQFTFFIVTFKKMIVMEEYKKQVLKIVKFEKAKEMHK